MTHFYSVYETFNLDILRRRDLAKESWKKQLWGDLPIKDEALPRLFNRDGKNVPYITDLFNYAAKDKPEDEILVFTNEDIQVRSDTAFVVAERLQSTNAVYCFRRDFPPVQVYVIPDDDYTKGHPYCGSDMYAFRVRWWKQHGHLFPDMLLAYEAWDAVLRHLIDETNPGRDNCLRDLIAHEKDGDSWWELPENRYTLIGQIYNLQLAVAWMAKRGIPAARHGIPPDFLTRGRRR